MVHVLCLQIISISEDWPPLYSPYIIPSPPLDCHGNQNGEGRGDVTVAAITLKKSNLLIIGYPLALLLTEFWFLINDPLIDMQDKDKVICTIAESSLPCNFISCNYSISPLCCPILPLLLINPPFYYSLILFCEIISRILLISFYLFYYKAFVDHSFL